MNGIGKTRPRRACRTIDNVYPRSCWFYPTPSIPVRTEPVEACGELVEPYERTFRGLPKTPLIRVVQAKDIPGLSNPYPSTSSGRRKEAGYGNYQALSLPG
ncbi:MAG: hypothetical protein LBD67_07730 [Candidatus Accumulibacter sp.]|nr:hypothetical protein [Accumulibacter sp.]